MLKAFGRTSARVGRREHSPDPAMALLAVVGSDGERLTVRRLNGRYWGDIKAGMGFWLCSFWPLLGMYAFALFLRWAHVSGSVPFGPKDILWWGVGTAFVVMGNLLPDAALLRPCLVMFDGSKGMVVVNGEANRLRGARVCLQDSFGPSRRAFRLVLRCEGREVVLAQTRRFTLATFAQKEYPFVATTEGMERKYWFNRWADYAGATTGYDPAWPEYGEIFRLCGDIEQFLSAVR